MKNFCIFIFSALFCLSCATDSFGVYHTVKKGETVSELSRLYQTDETLIREENSIQEGIDELQEGSAIFIPGAEKVLEPKPVDLTKAQNNEKKAQTIPSEEPETENNNTINFIWPAHGKIVSQFSTVNQKYDGIDIQLEQNTEIHAAAEGKVVFSAKHLKLGNMIIINHNEDFYTIYAFLSTNIAKEGQTLKQNDILGIVEVSEQNPHPAVHFEIRKNGKPVDPLNFLPEN